MIDVMINHLTFRAKSLRFVVRIRMVYRYLFPIVVVVHIMCPAHI